MHSGTMSAHPTARPSDDELLARWAGGDSRAGNAFTRRFHPVLQQFLKTKVPPDDVEDLAQQVWLALGGNFSRKGVEVRASVKAYLLGIARNVLFKHIRHKYRGITDPITTSIVALDPSLSQAVNLKIQADRLRWALQTLPLDTQVLLELRYLHDLTTLAIAEIYDLPEGTVKSRLSRARAILQETLRKCPT